MQPGPAHLPSSRLAAPPTGKLQRKLLVQGALLRIVHHPAGDVSGAGLANYALVEWVTTPGTSDGQ